MQHSSGWLTRYIEIGLIIYSQCISEKYIEDKSDIKIKSSHYIAKEFIISDGIFSIYTASTSTKNL